MIQSKLSRWVFYKVIAFTIFFLILSMPAYIIEGAKHTSSIVWVDFFKTVGILTIFGLILFLITILQKKKVLISDSNITLRNYLTTEKKEISFTEIKGMTWMNRNKQHRSLKGLSTSVNLQEFSIYFKDLTTLTISKKDYENYEEMANWFFKYCRKHEIIKTDPLEVRKRSRYRRPEKVKKL